jgi:hypothetical protein
MLPMRLQPVLALVLEALLCACAATTPTGRVPAVPPSRMIESTDLAEVAQAALELAETFGSGNVLVVFDLDNTLLAMEQDLGSDQWWDWQRRLKDEAPCAPERVGDPLAVQGALYYASAMRLTQANAPDLVRRLHQAGLNTLVLSSRGPAYRLQTFRELRRHGLRFGQHSIGPPGGYPDEFVPAGGTRPARFEDGVFLTAGQHKGDMLRALLELTATPDPAVIVMADDKTENLQAVLDTYAESAVTVRAYRYGREDAVVAGFDAAGAARQWRQAGPALRALQGLFGPDHFQLPEHDRPEGCAEPGG